MKPELTENEVREFASRQYERPILTTLDADGEHAYYPNDLAAFALKQMDALEREARARTAWQKKCIYLEIERTAARAVVEAAQKAIDDWQLDWDSKAYSMMATTIAEYRRVVKGEQG